MVLIGSAGLALFSWINGNILTLSRIHDVNSRSDATINILEYMDRVNPMITPEGGVTLGTYAIKWLSQPTTNVTDGVNYPQGQSLYQLALFDTTVSVSANDGKDWFELRLQQVGYKKVRSITVK